jgi:hypothetical protein
MLRHSLARQPYCRVPSQLSECVVPKEGPWQAAGCKGVATKGLLASGGLPSGRTRLQAMWGHRWAVCASSSEWSLRELVPPGNGRGVAIQGLPARLAGRPLDAHASGRCQPVERGATSRGHPLGRTRFSCQLLLGVRWGPRQAAGCKGVATWGLLASGGLPSGRARLQAMWGHRWAACASSSERRLRELVLPGSGRGVAIRGLPARLAGRPLDALHCWSRAGARWRPLAVVLRCKLVAVGGGSMQAGDRWRRSVGATWRPLEAVLRCKLVAVGGGPVQVGDRWRRSVGARRRPLEAVR